MVGKDSETSLPVPGRNQILTCFDLSEENNREEDGRRKRANMVQATAQHAAVNLVRKAVKSATSAVALVYSSDGTPAASLEGHGAERFKSHHESHAECVMVCAVQGLLPRPAVLCHNLHAPRRQVPLQRVPAATERRAHSQPALHDAGAERLCVGERVCLRSGARGRSRVPWLASGLI